MYGGGGGGGGGNEGDLNCQWTGYQSTQLCTILATYIVLIKLTII